MHAVQRPQSLEGDQVQEMRIRRAEAEVEGATWVRSKSTCLMQSLETALLI